MTFASPAASAGGLRFVGSANSAVVTDGARFAAVEIDTGRTGVIDTLTGRSYTVATPAGCAQRYLTDGLTSVGGGRLMWTCGATAPGYPEFMNLLTRQVSPWPGLYGAARQLMGNDDVAFTAVGSAWVAVTIYGKGMTVNDTYIGITGDRLERDDIDQRRAIDLNSSELERPLCRGLRRGITTDLGGFPPSPPAPLPYTYQRPYGLGLFGENYVDKLVLQRCGHPERLLCRKACTSAQLGSGVVTWVEKARTVRLMRAGSRRPRSFSVPAPPANTQAAHTSNTLFVSVPTINPTAHGPSAYSWRIYTAQI